MPDVFLNKITSLLVRQEQQFHSYGFLSTSRSEDRDTASQLLRSETYRKLNVNGEKKCTETIFKALSLQYSS